MLSEAIYWILSNNYAIPHIIHLLNNFLIISPPNVIPASQILAVKKFSLSLGSLFPRKNYAVTQACCDKLALWIKFLKQWNGLTFFCNNLVSFPIDIQLFTDAAPSVGFGGFYQGHWFASPWPPQLQDFPQSSVRALSHHHSSFLWGKGWTANSILVHCDNKATVQCINKGRSHSPTLMPLLKPLVWISVCN